MSKKSAGAEVSSRNDEYFLPNFGKPAELMRLIGITQLMVLVMVLVSADAIWPFPWDRMLLMTLLVQWIVLVSAGLLYVMRPHLMQFSNGIAAGISFLAVVIVVAWFSLIAPFAIDFMRINFFYEIKPSAIIRNVLIGMIISGFIMRYFFLQEQLRVKQKTELNARLQALQSRIRPHFLFNSMNIIASLIHVDPDKAEQAVEDLSQLFRASLKAEGEIAMSDELDLCQHYVNIEKFRLGERLQMTWQLHPDTSRLRIPALLLQPLIENAIYHSVERRAEPSEVLVKIDYDGKRVTIMITNPVAPPAAHARGNKMALHNIRQRLQAHYGESAQMIAETTAKSYSTYLSYPFSVSHIDKAEKVA